MRRFEGQDETTKHLEALQKDNEKQITRLKEDKEKLQMEFEEMKYTGDAKLSRSVHRSCQTLKVNTQVMPNSQGHTLLLHKVLMVP